MKINIKRKRIAAGLSVAALLIMLCSGLLCATARRAVVLDGNGKYFRARIVWSGAGLFIALRADTLYDDRAKAVEAPEEGGSPSFAALRRIALIEFLPEPVETTGDDATPPGEPINYFGQFAVNAAGNQGVLLIWQQDGAAYGTIRFPGWGRGVAEPLKGLVLSGRTIRFVRSAGTADELRYVGGSAYFVQEYYGEYRGGGTEIVGFYVVQGQRKQWEAYRAR
ncbi:MAG: hypothetical protein EPN93_11985 [Spirochaetes bacterium]|nr:MAG: hypothetical protein EPN93_11985 [Spirochaetota bacterium]